jgi:hypothetical protein
MFVKTLPALCLALVCVASLAHAQDVKKDAPASPFEKFKALAGEWTGTGTHDGHKMDATATYKVTSGGSAVVEMLGPGSEHEMVTVIHPDGDKLALTHYCAVGNQPQMQAAPKAGENKLDFQFVRATNLKSDKDMHMHTVTYTFVDKDTLKSEWTLFNDGKEAGKAIFELKRKK